MIRITITPAAYAAIAGTLPWGTVGVEPKRAENGDYYIWVAPGVVNTLRALREPGESYSDGILRVAKEEAANRSDLG